MGSIEFEDEEVGRAGRHRPVEFLIEDPGRDIPAFVPAMGLRILAPRQVENFVVFGHWPEDKVPVLATSPMGAKAVCSVTTATIPDHRPEFRSRAPRNAVHEGAGPCQVVLLNTPFVSGPTAS
jgi:hypothetical protein